MTTQNPKVRIGVIGCGQMAQLAHLPCLAAHPEVEIAGICARRREVVDKVAKHYDISFSTHQPEALLEQKLDGVAILTPVETHLPLVEMAMEAGVAIFVEKPAAFAASSVDKMMDLQKKSGATVRVGYMKRHESNLQLLKKRAEDEDWGTLIYARSHSFIGGHWNGAIDRFIQPISTESPVTAEPIGNLDPGPSWLEGERSRSFYSFGNPYYAWLDPGIHSVNLLQHLIPGAMQVRDIQLGSGLRVAQLQVEEVPVSLEFCLNFSMNRWDEVTELYYEKASVRILTPPPLDRQASAVVEIYSEPDGRPETLTMQDNHDWAFQNQMNAFVANVQSGHLINDLPQSRTDLQLMETIYQKGEENQ